MKMKTNRSLVLAVLMATLVVVATTSNAVEREECITAVVVLVIAEHTVVEAIHRAESAQELMESKKEELDYCRRFPDIHKVSPDNCDTLRWAFESLRIDHERACSALGSKLKRLIAIIRVVQSNCEEERLHP